MGRFFGGWEIYHIKGSPVDPNRLYASQCSGWFGQMIQRSNDGGKTWEPVGNKFVYEGTPGTHMWYDGTPHPWEFKRVWHLEPSLTDPDYGLRRRGRCGLIPHHRWRPELGRNAGHAKPRFGFQVAARRGRYGFAYDSDRSDESAADVHCDLVRRRVSHRRRRRVVDADQPRPCARNTSPIPMPKSATAFTGLRCTGRGPMCSLCKSIGT